MGLLDQINEVLLQTPRKYWGEKATRLGSLLSDSASTGAQAYASANGPLAPEHALCNSVAVPPAPTSSSVSTARFSTSSVQLSPSAKRPFSSRVRRAAAIR